LSDAIALERELKAVMKSGKVVLGVKEALKLLLSNELKGLVIADNTPYEVRERLTYVAKLNNVPVTIFKGTSTELGSVIGKPFKVSVIGIIDPGDSKIIDLLLEQQR
jgi:large subunit ribosomal protein L30e